MIRLNAKSITTHILTKAPVILICWCLFYLTGCKDPLINDTDLLTSDDDLSLAKDTLFPQCFSLFESPLASNAVAVGALGNLTDPAFGKTVSGFYGQCALTSNNVNFGTGATLDSAFITFAYAGQYGKFDQPVTVVAYELSQSPVDSLTYKTNDVFSVSIPRIGQVNSFVPNLKDTINIYGVAYPAHLRIPLTTAFGNKILLADAANLADNTAFKNYFKGFYVTTTTTPAGNGTLYLSLSSTLSKITLYYHNNDADSLTFDIPVSGVKVNHFDNNYAGTPVYTVVNSPNPLGETKLYLQGGAGVKGKILLPDLDSLPKGIAINKAELILSQSNESTDTTYVAPLLLDLFRIDDAGVAQQLEDDGLSHFGGVKVAETVNGEIINRYRFNIKKYFQNLINGTYKNNGFFVQIVGANSNSERVVIANSSSDEKYKVTLVVTYTKL